MIDIDAAACKKAGISPSDILTTMQGYYGGLYASNFNRFGKMYRVMIQSDPLSRKNLESLKNIKVRNSAGFPESGPVPYSQGSVLQPLDRKDTEKSLGSPQIPLYGGDTACRSGTGCPFPVQYKDRRDFPHLRRHSALHSAERNPPSSQWNYAGGFQRNPLSSGTVLRPYHQS